MPAEIVDRLLYASLSHVTGPIFREMEAIREAAVRNNLPLGVYTALLYQSGWFLQWKEGPQAAVQQIMARVALDTRHSGLCVLHQSRGPRLLPEPWSMAIVQLGDTPEAFGQRVAAMHEEHARGLQYAPPAVWRRLSTPLVHPGADRLTDSEGFQRVMVCAARGTESFGLVKWLAEQHGAEIVRRRFAGATPPDVATDFVDVLEGGHVMRLVAMARNGLMLGLTRAFLQDCSHLVLLFSGQDELDQKLFHRAILALGGAVSSPAIVSLGLTPTANEPLHDEARRLGLIYLDAGPVASDDSRQVWQAMLPMLEHHRTAQPTSWPVAAKR